MASNIQTESIECVVCQERYDEKTRIPKRLQCPHTVCVLCLKQLIHHNKGRTKCPLCNAKQKIDDADKLITDIGILQCVDMFNNMSELLMKCADCCKLESHLNDCKNCDARVCRRCLRRHQTLEYCDVLHDFRQISKKITDDKIKRAQEFKSKISKELTAIHKIEMDIDTIMRLLNEKRSFFQERKSFITDTDTMIDELLESREVIKRGKMMLDDEDSDLSMLRTDCERILELVNKCEDNVTVYPMLNNSEIIMQEVEKLGQEEQIGQMKAPQIPEHIVQWPEKEPFFQMRDRMSHYDHRQRRSNVPLARGYQTKGFINQPFDSNSDISDMEICTSSGRIYIAESYFFNSSNIFIVDPARMRKIGEFKVPGSVSCLTVISNLQLAVVYLQFTDHNSSNFCLRVCTTTGQEIRHFPFDTNNSDTSFRPRDIVHHNGKLYITAFDNQSIAVWTVEGLFCKYIKHDQMQNPLRLAVNSRGNLFVTVADNSVIHVLKQDGSYKATISRAGEEPLSVSRIALDNEDNLLVAGKTSKLIIDVFNPEHTHLSRLESSIQCDCIRGLCITLTGDILIATDDGMIMVK